MGKKEGGNYDPNFESFMGYLNRERSPEERLDDIFDTIEGEEGVGSQEEANSMLAEIQALKEVFSKDPKIIKGLEEYEKQIITGPKNKE